MAKGRYFTFPQETWDVKKCRKLAKATQKDGMGTKYPFKGYIHGTGGSVGGYGQTRYNGGCVHNDEWYEGEIRLLPIIPKGFKFVVVPTWGTRIVEES